MSKEQNDKFITFRNWVIKKLNFNIRWKKETR